MKLPTKNLFSNFVDMLHGTNKQMVSLNPVLAYHEQGECFQLRNQEYMDMVRIVSKDLVNAVESEVDFDVSRFLLFYRIYVGDLKIVGLNLPTETADQQRYVEHKLSRANSDLFREELGVKLSELQWIENNTTERKFYFFFYGDTVEQLRENRNTILYMLGGDLVERIDREEKELLFFKFNNMNSVVRKDPWKERVLPSMDGLALQNIIAQKGYDPFLLERNQPQGGISFGDERYMKTGEGYLSCVNVYRLTPTPRPFWLKTLCDIENTIVTIDIRTENMVEIIKNINKSMVENKIRSMSEKDASERNAAISRYEKLEDLLLDIQETGEVLKNLTIRIFVSGKTMADLDKSVSAVLDELQSHGYTGAVFLNESKNDWLSFYRSSKKQQTTLYKRQGMAVSSHQLAGGDPFHFTSLIDKRGTYFGRTLGSKGSVLLDTFAKTEQRKSYNSLVVGKTGSGKSTFTKKMMMDRALRGDYIRGIDPTGEWTTLVQYLGGRIINLDGSQGKINVWEIFRTGETEKMSYAMHLSKLNNFYRYLNPDAPSLESIEFERMARKLYTEFGILQEDREPDEEHPITGLPTTSYPIFSDFYRLLVRERKELLEKNLSDVEREAIRDRMQRLERIEMVVENIIRNYGYIFDGHTSIENMLHTQIVFFNVKGISSLKSELFDAQMYNALLLCWNNCLVTCEPMYHAYADGKIEWDDITRFGIYIEEAHHILNSERLYAVQEILTYIRIDRKYFGGINMIIQEITDVIGDGENRDAVAALQKIFNEQNIKVVFQQDSSNLPIMQQCFGKSITPTQLSHIPKYGKGQALLVIDGDQNVEFKVDCSDSELALYRGGV